MIANRADKRRSWTVTLIRAGAILAVGGWAALWGFAFAGEQTAIRIGSTDTGDSSYVAAQALCRVVNLERQKVDLLCIVEPTGGSLASVGHVMSGRISFGIVLSSVEHDALYGSDSFRESGPVLGLRAVFSLGEAPMQLVAGAATGIATLADIKGRSINIGNRGSGTNVSFMRLMRASGWRMADFGMMLNLPHGKTAAALCQGEIDAVFLATALGGGPVAEAAATCPIVLVPLLGPAIDSLLREYPYYERMDIPAGLFPGVTKPVASYGVRSVLVTSAALPDQLVYGFTKAVFEGLAEVRKADRQLAYLDPKKMAHDGLLVPIHPGAARYFREVGLLKP